MIKMIYADWQRPVWALRLDITIEKILLAIACLQTALILLLI